MMLKGPSPRALCSGGGHFPQSSKETFLSGSAQSKGPYLTPAISETDMQASELKDLTSWVGKTAMAHRLHLSPFLPFFPFQGVLCCLMGRPSR